MSRRHCDCLREVYSPGIDYYTCSSLIMTGRQGSFCPFPHDVLTPPLWGGGQTTRTMVENKLVWLKTATRRKRKFSRVANPDPHVLSLTKIYLHVPDYTYALRPRNSYIYICNTFNIHSQVSASSVGIRVYIRSILDIYTLDMIWEPHSVSEPRN